MASSAPTGVSHRLVTASAGTGKTYRLTLELLRRLRGGARPDQILAATFTRKAAAEILERVLLRLATAVLEPEQASRLVVELDATTVADDGAADLDPGRQAELLLRELVGSLHRLSVATLDAFFYRVLLRFRLELGLPASPIVLAADDPRVDRVRSRALGRMLDGLAADDFDELLRLLDELHDQRRSRSVAADLDRLFLELYEVWREAPDPAVWGRLCDPGRQLDPAERECGREALRGLERHRMPPGARSAWRQDLARVEGEDWRRFLELGLAGKIASEGDAASYRNWRIPPEVRSAYRPLLEHARASVLARTRRETRATFTLLQRFDLEFTRLRRQRRLVLFSDLAWLLAHELPVLAPERLQEVHYRLDARVGHLLLDEFQDTSLDQWRVLEPFAEEIWAWGDGSRSFFCVGDPKQAIYGWRGGCADLFGVIEERLVGVGGSCETLELNWRSSPVVLEVVDRVFPALLDVEELGDQRPTVARWLDQWSSPRAADPERPGRVELVVAPPLAGEGRPVEEGNDENGEGVGLGEELDTLVDVVARSRESAPEATIGVLLRTNRAAARALEALRRRGLDASGEGGSSLIDDPAVTLLLSALLLAEHPEHGPARHQVATSPLGEMLGLRGPDDALAVSRRLRRQVAALGVSRTIAEWSRRLAPWLDRRSATRLSQLLSAAESWEGAGGARLRELVDYARAVRVAEPQPAPIRVMTVHKAKGLEFDVVVLGELLRPPPKPSQERALWLRRPSPTAPPDGVFRRSREAIARLDRALEDARQQELDRGLWDDLSALYVALTRARHALHLVVGPWTEEARSIAPGSWAALLVRTLCGRPLTVDDRGLLFELGDPDWARTPEPAVENGEARPREVAAEPPPPRPRPATAGARRNLPRFRPSAAGRESGRVRAAELLRLEPELERLRGSVLHAWLAAIEWLDAGAGLAARPELWRLARQVAPQAEEGWLEGLLHDLEVALRAPEIERALCRPELPRGARAELWRERPFALVSGGRLWHGRFDRVVVVRQRTRVLGAELYDFKSDRLTGEDALGEASARYDDQLQSYRQALAALLGVLPTAVRASFVFLDVGRVVARG